MLVRADEAVGREIYLFGEYEVQDAKYIAHQIAPAAICADVGANVGFYSLLLARCAHQGKVHAFEPVPLNYHILSANVLANRIANVELNQCAVGDKEAQVAFTLAADGAFSSFVDTGRRPCTGSILVGCTTLDRYCAEQHIARLDFIKVDVEGAEAWVIRGAQQLLSDRNRRPSLMMIELYEPMLEKYDASIDSILASMREFEYRPFVIRRGKLVPFTTEYYNRVHNVFFSPA